MAGSNRLSRKWEYDRVIFLPHHSLRFGWDLARSSRLSSHLAQVIISQF